MPCRSRAGAYLTLGSVTCRLPIPRQPRLSLFGAVDAVSDSGLRQGEVALNTNSSTTEHLGMSISRSGTAAPSICMPGRIRWELLAGCWLLTAPARLTAGIGVGAVGVRTTPSIWSVFECTHCNFHIYIIIILPLCRCSFTDAPETREWKAGLSSPCSDHGHLEVSRDWRLAPSWYRADRERTPTSRRRQRGSASSEAASHSSA